MGVDAGEQMAMDLAAVRPDVRPQEERSTPPRERTPPHRITREDVMTAAEVAALLAMPKSTIYELARRGELPCARLGRTMRFLRDDVEARLQGR
jgi:excisionase family DNA binding protein